MKLDDNHPLRIHTLEDMKINLRIEMRAARPMIADSKLNTETRHMALGRANVAEQILAALGEDIDVTQSINGR